VAELSTAECRVRRGECQRPDAPSPGGHAALRPPHSRLITITGPGGAGKTRLAWEAAVRRQEAQSRPFWWVSLAERRDAGGLLEAVAEALGLDTVPGVGRLDQIPAALR